MTEEPPGVDEPPTAPVRTLHVVLLSHLDTQWRWTEAATIEDFLPATVDANEALFRRFPFYVLSFEGAYRYQLLAEHDPQRFERLATWVHAGRWHVAGAPLDAFDANLPAPESILRHCLYGSRWLARRLATVPRELLLPDCFGFPASLPTLAAHAGLAGFSTQKLRKGPEMRAAFGVPFAYGVWQGPDGSELLAALDPGEYGKPPARWPGNDPEWLAAFATAGGTEHPRRRMAYFGVGDKGGALAAEAVARLDPSDRPPGPIDVRLGASDAIYQETGAAERATLPRHVGDLLLSRHGVGCYTAQGGMKRWNRVNERLARAAEMAAALAWRLGRAYPAARLERAWTRFLVRQMHDDLTGTAIPAAYRLSYGDEALAANDFAEVLLDSMATVARALDRGGEGHPILVFDPYAGTRETLVEIALAPEELALVGAVLDPEGAPLPFQLECDAAGARLLVALGTRGAGASLLRLRPAAGSPPVVGGPVGADPGNHVLRGGGLTARFDETGDLAALAAEAAEGGVELLAAAVRLELLPDRPRKYPAWEIEYRDYTAPPRARVGAPRSAQWLEQGPLRASLRIAREALGSRFVETWRLAAGSPWLEVESEIDWRTRGALLVASVPCAAASPQLLCDLGIGVAARPIASERLYEVPAYRWSALADATGGPGLAVLCDERSGRSHPDPHTQRLTLIHSPATWRRFPHQATQDFGRQRVRWALAPLPPGREAAAANAVAESWACRPIALAAAPAPRPAVSGRRRICCVDLGAHAASLLALKRAEDSERLVVRLRETAGEATRLEVTLAASVTAIEELDAAERPSPPPDGAPETPLAHEGASLAIELRPWSLRTLAVELHGTPAAEPPDGQPLALRGRLHAFSRDGEVSRTGFDDRGRCFPLELAPTRLDDGPVPFDLTPVHGGGGVRAGDGGTLDVPTGFAELWWLGASCRQEEVAARFLLGDRRLDATFPPWLRPLAAPDRRLFGGLLGLVTRRGWSRRAPLAWYATHLHDRRGRNLAARRGMLFAVSIPLDGTGGPLRLPVARDLRLVAATLVREPARPLRERSPLIDAFD